MKNKRKMGHLICLITVSVWGSTFISTKLLLADFLPAEILLYRFLLGFLALSLAYPHRLHISNRKQELTFAAAGFCGVTLYFLLENIALTYTLASNVGVIISISPFFSAIVSHLFFKEEEPLHGNFFLGFLVAIAGIILISFNGKELALNPLGDLLALGAAFVWACYSALTKKIAGYGYHMIQTTRRIFFYGILLMLPTMHFFGVRLPDERFLKPVNGINILYLGFCASALCFVTWNVALKILGVVKTSVYIYMVPVITVVLSAVILHEKITPLAVAGTLLTLGGLVISEHGGNFAENNRKGEIQEDGE